MVLAELAGVVAEIEQELGERRGAGPQIGRAARQLRRDHAGAQRMHAGEEGVAPGRAALLGVVVHEDRAFIADAIDVGRFPDHQAAVVDARLHPADVVTHDEEDVGLSALLLCGRWRAAPVRTTENDISVAAPNHFWLRTLACFLVIVLRKSGRQPRGPFAPEVSVRIANPRSGRDASGLLARCIGTNSVRGRARPRTCARGAVPTLIDDQRAIAALAASIFAFTASRLKLAPFCIGGNSTAVMASFSTCCWTNTKRQNSYLNQ